MKAGPSLRNRVTWDVFYNLSCTLGRVIYPSIATTAPGR